MITSLEVLNKIREISRKTVNPLHRIMLNGIVVELVISKDALLVLLVELEDRGLIKIHRSAVVSVSLTIYGLQQDSPLNGFSSE